MADSALLEQFVDGAISPTVIARNTESFLAVLVRQGFTVDEALAAFELVSACAIGLAVAAIRERRSAEWGEPSPTDELRRVAEEDPAELPLMSTLAARAPTDTDERALTRLRSVVLGLAVTRGEDPDEARRIIEGATVDPRA